MADKVSELKETLLLGDIKIEKCDLLFDEEIQSSELILPEFSIKQEPELILENEFETEKIQCFLSSEDLLLHEESCKEFGAANQSTFQTTKYLRGKTSQCDLSYRENHNLKIHGTNIAEHPNKCRYCDKVYTKNYTLLRHMRMHTGEKLFQCDRCDHTCTEKSNLIRHYRTHTGERPYKCPNCNKAFTESGLLSRHMITHAG